MRKLIIIIVVLAGAWFGWSKFRGPGAAPSSQDIEPVIKAFVQARAGKDCSGTFSVTALNITSVGDYMDGAGGFPVYGDYSTHCHEGVTDTSAEFGKDSSAPLAYVRRSGSGYEAFIPTIFEQAFKEMDEQFQRAVEPAH